MSIPSSCDVVIIGGGPAGSVAASMLAKDGHDVVMLERESHPREKVGESLIPDFWKFTDKIGVTDKIKAEGFVAKAGAIIAWDGQFKAHTFADFGYTTSAMHVERPRFDQILFEHAASLGAQTFENTAVTKADLGVNDDGSEYARVMYRDANGDESDILAKYVIDASGQAGVISRQLGTRIIDDSFRYLSVWGYFEGSKFLTIEGKAEDRDQLGEHKPVTFVTSLNDIEARNLGRDGSIDHDLRYDRADEFVEVVLGHWDTWADDALIVDKETKRFADGAKVKRLSSRSQSCRGVPNSRRVCRYRRISNSSTHPPGTHLAGRYVSIKSGGTDRSQ